MKKNIITLFVLLFAINISAQEVKSEFYNFSAKKLNSELVNFKSLQGKTVLIVNTASKCGFTPQYEGLEELYQKYKDKGLIILGFPCNQFGKQEPGSSDEIKEFCTINYGVTFPMFEKIDVNGENAAPLYVYLKNVLPGTLGNDIKWNFTKFLIDKNGKPIERYGSTTKPKDIEDDILKLLNN